MQGKVVVITGGTSGIGQVAAERLAAMGARIVLVARSKSRGEATLARLREIAPADKHAFTTAMFRAWPTAPAGGGNSSGRAPHRRADQQCRARCSGNVK